MRHSFHLGHKSFHNRQNKFVVPVFSRAGYARGLTELAHLGTCQRLTLSIYLSTRCRNWTAGNSTTLPGKAQVGHHDRESKTPGAGLSPWNSAHATRGCGQEDLKESGGDGLIYCFVTK